MSDYDDAANRADFAPLGDMEFDTIPALYEFAQYGRAVTANGGLIIMQSAFDLKRACLTIPVMDGRPNAKATRAARPLRRAALHMRAIQRCFAIVPTVFMRTYEQEIGATRNRNRRGIDLGRG